MSAPQRRVPEDQTPLPQGYLNLKFLPCDLSFSIELRDNFAGGFSHPGHLSCIQGQDPDIGIGQFIKPPFKRGPGTPVWERAGMPEHPGPPRERGLPAFPPS